MIKTCIHTNQFFGLHFRILFLPDDSGICMFYHNMKIDGYKNDKHNMTIKQMNKKKNHVEPT